MLFRFTHFPRITLACLCPLVIAGCSPSPYSAYSPYSSTPFWAPFQTRQAQNFCTEQRITEIAKINTAEILKLSHYGSISDLGRLVGPQRRDILKMTNGEMLEVWYYRTYIDSTNTSMGYDVGLTPITVNSSGHVLAIGAPASQQFRGRAMAQETLDYNAPCENETQYSDLYRVQHREMYNGASPRGVAYAWPW